MDGNVIENIPRNLFDRGSKHPFTIGGHNCIILIETNGFTFKYDLIVDNISLESGERFDTDKALKTQIDEWKELQEKGKLQFVLARGLFPGAISFAILRSGEALFKWNRYKKKVI